MSADASECNHALVDSVSKNENRLHLAVSNGNLADCKYLLRHQAALQYQYNEFGLKPLHQAIRLNNCSVLRYFLKNGSTAVRTSTGSNILQYAAQYGRSFTLQLVVVCLGPKLAKAYANEVDQNGSTVLHYAAATGSRENVCLLFKISKSGLCFQDSQGMLPFHHALMCGYYFTAELIADLMNEEFEDLLLKRPECFLVFLEQCFDPWTAEQIVQRCPRLVLSCPRAVSHRKVLACAEKNTKISRELLEILEPLEGQYSY